MQNMQRLVPHPGTLINHRRETFNRVLEHTLPWLVLLVLVTYSLGNFFRHSYGFRWSNPDGTIREIYVNEREPTVHKGDRILRVGSTDIGSFESDLRKDLFGGAKPGDIVPITVQRADQTLTVDWRMPGTNEGELFDQLSGQWFLGYFFWIAGTLTLLVVRPRDERWLLMAAFNFVTSIWLVMGSGLSGVHLWYSALILRAAMWLSLPVYLHLHWVFPRPLSHIPRAGIAIVYAVGIGMAIAQWTQATHPGMYLIAFLLAVLGSLLLLVVHFVQQPDMRRGLAFLLGAAGMATLPTLAVAAIASRGALVPSIARLALLSFPVLPFAYLYAAFRSQLGGLEVRANRALSIYAFLILLGTVIVSLLVISARLPAASPDQGLITGIVTSAIAAAACLWVYPMFQKFVERRLLGIVVPSQRLQQSYSSSITSSTSFASLTRLLTEDVMPSLLVRQFVFLVLENGTSRVLASSGVTDDNIPTRETRRLLEPLAAKPGAEHITEPEQLSWIQLVLPLRVEQEVLGYWIFGRRDPEDVYSSVEIPILQSFADQTAIALSNMLLTERLRTMYQADINRHEKERVSLARNLHDSVLNELAGMLMSADIEALPKNFQDGYRAMTERLREIVSDLRLPMLNYGLNAAITELGDNLMERSKDALNVVVHIAPEEARYPLEMEQHLFRIVQEACENAVRHSHGTKLTILGQLGPDYGELHVVDNGSGFQLGKADVELYDLLSDGHYGLAGMFERAKLIEARIQIASSPGAGTAVSIRWGNDPKSKERRQASD